MTSNLLVCNPILLSADENALELLARQRAILSDKLPDFMQMFFLFVKDASASLSVIPVGCKWRDDDEKARVYGFIKSLAKSINTVALASVMESWFVTSVRDDEMDRVIKKYKSLKDAPGRKECLIMIYQDSGQSKCWMAEIKEGRVLDAWTELADSQGSLSHFMASVLQPSSKVN